MPYYRRSRSDQETIAAQDFKRALRGVPFHYIEKEDGTWIVPSRQLSTEISYERPEILAESILGASIALSSWVADDIAHTGTHLAGEVHGTACPPGEICLTPVE